MFHLTEDELQHGFDAIEHHGYSGLLPPPLEWQVVQTQWQNIRQELSAIDLDNYNPSVPLRVYAPKNRATVRMVSMLHPIDLLIYTSLTLIVKDDLEKQRILRSKKIVFSYRTRIGTANILYETENLFEMFQERLNNRSARPKIRYVAIADISDFLSEDVPTPTRKRNRILCI